MNTCKETLLKRARKLSINLFSFNTQNITTIKSVKTMKRQSDYCYFCNFSSNVFSQVRVKIVSVSKEVEYLLPKNTLSTIGDINPYGSETMGGAASAFKYEKTYKSDEPTPSKYECKCGYRTDSWWDMVSHKKDHVA